MFSFHDYRMCCHCREPGQIGKETNRLPLIVRTSRCAWGNISNGDRLIRMKSTPASSRNGAWSPFAFFLPMLIVAHLLFAHADHLHLLAPADETEPSITTQHTQGVKTHLPPDEEHTSEFVEAECPVPDISLRPDADDIQSSPVTSVQHFVFELYEQAPALTSFAASQPRLCGPARHAILQNFRL
jgi:hypothetical protein